MVIRLLLMGLLLAPGLVWGQRIITQTDLKPARGYVGEPRLLSIKVLSETYFTAGVDIPNLKIDGAFLVPRQNTSTTEKIDGQTWAGVTINFYVFPFEDGELNVPAGKIFTQSPAPGDFRGKEITITTKARKFTVTPVPPNADEGSWLVANNLTVRQQWDKKLDQMKVGDVISRTLTFTVSNTLSEFIPQMNWPSIEGVSSYPQQAQVENNIDKNSISGKRTERVSYLLERAGEVVLPGIRFSFYHPGRRTFISRKITPETITVLPNEDLELVASMKDSLNAYLAQDEVTGEDRPVIPEITREQLLILLLVLAAIWLIHRLKLIPKLVRYFKRRRESYLHSEPYYYAQFKKESGSGEPRSVINALYRYLDVVKPPKYDHTLNSVSEGTLMEESVEDLKATLYRSTAEEWNVKDLKGAAAKTRRHALKSRGGGETTGDGLPFNP